MNIWDKLTLLALYRCRLAVVGGNRCVWHFLNVIAARVNDLIRDGCAGNAVMNASVLDVVSVSLNHLVSVGILEHRWRCSSSTADGYYVYTIADSTQVATLCNRLLREYNLGFRPMPASDELTGSSDNQTINGLYNEILSACTSQAGPAIASELLGISEWHKLTLYALSTLRVTECECAENGVWFGAFQVINKVHSLLVSLPPDCAVDPTDIYCGVTASLQALANLSIIDKREHATNEPVLESTSAPTLFSSATTSATTSNLAYSQPIQQLIKYYKFPEFNTLVLDLQQALFNELQQNGCFGCYCEETSTAYRNAVSANRFLVDGHCCDVSLRGTVAADSLDEVYNKRVNQVLSGN